MTSPAERLAIPETLSLLERWPLEKQVTRIGELNGPWAWGFKVCTVLIPIITLCATALVSLAIRNESRLTALESNRFTAANGLEVWKAIAGLKEEIVTLPTKMPPPWFISRVDKIEQNLEIASVKLAELVTIAAKHIAEDDARDGRIRE